MARITPKKEEALVQDRWKTRILGTGSEKPEDLLPNPHNWRTHPDRQKYAVQGVLNEVGWVSSVTVNKRTGRLLDGHLRVALAIEQGATEVPVTYVDVSEDEEMLVLATLDRLTEMAGINPDALAYVLEKIEVEDIAVKSILDELAEEAGLGVQAQEDDEDAKTQIAKEIAYKYELVFEDEDHLQVWYQFLKFLRLRFPDSEVVSDRLVRFIQESVDMDTVGTGEPGEDDDAEGSEDDE